MVYVRSNFNSILHYVGLTSSVKQEPNNIYTTNTSTNNNNEDPICVIQVNIASEIQVAMI